MASHKKPRKVANKIRKLDVRLRSIARLMKKWTPSQKIIMADISLGKLRESYKRCHSKVDNDTLKVQEPMFTWYAPDSRNPLEIRAKKDGGLLIYCLPATDPKIAQILYNSSTLAPHEGKTVP